MKKSILFFLFCLLLVSSFAQPVIQWQKCLGGTSTESATWIRQTNDNGYIVNGWSYSNDGDVSGHHGSSDSLDLWVAKLDSSGNIQWQKSLGGSNMETEGAIIQTNDNGYLVCGPSRSNDGDVSGNHGGYDCWIIKIDSNGTIQWQNSFGGSNDERLLGLPIQTNDGGYILAADSYSNNGDVSGNHGGEDIWVFKIDSIGNLQWQKSLGGSNDEFPTAFFNTYDGNYAIIGTTYSFDGDVAINHGAYDYWLVKIDTIGNILWEKTFGSVNGEFAHDGMQTSDNGFILSGWNADTTNCSYTPFNGWLVKTDSVGNIQWQNCFGGSSPTDIITSIRQLNNGNYVMVGITGSNDGNVSGNHGNSDVWLVRIDDIGNIIWQKCLGGSSAETTYSLELTYDQEYIFAGRTASNNGDVSGNHGSWDYWVVKLAPDTITGITNFGSDISNFDIYPNPNDGNFIINYSSLHKKIVTLEIFNVIGNRVYSQPLPQWVVMQEINLSALTVGIYNCVITSGNERVSRRVVVIKE